MSRDGTEAEQTEEDLKQDLQSARATIQQLEAELAETNEGMIALTLELEEAKERYQKIFEASSDAILLIDPDEDEIYEANPQACELFGYSHDSLKSLSAADIFPDEDGQDESFIDAVFNGWVDDFTCRTKDGKQLEIEVSASVFKLEGRPLLLAALRDVTERKRRVQQLQVLNRVFRHNLRNDGNVIQGHADILHDGLSGSTHQESATTIRRAITEILGLSGKVRRIQDILNRQYVSPIEFSDMLEKEQIRVRKAYPEATILTETSPSDALVGQRLSSALYEAIENGIKHNDEAQPVVSVSAEIDDDGEQLVITVADQGPGLPDQERNVIQKGEESPLEHGSGVGLWFILWVVSSLSGELRIQANTPRGTRLLISVPIQSGNEPGTHQLPGKQALKERSNDR